MVNVWSMTKKSFCFKNPFLAKNALFSKIMSQSKDFFWFIQAPYIFKHISKNGGATIKASRKTAHDKVFLILGQKGHFFSKRPFFFKKWRDHQKKVIALNMYIGTTVLMYERWLVLKVWYMAGRPAGSTLSPLRVHVSQKWTLWVPLHLSGVLSREKTPLRLAFSFRMKMFYRIILTVSNIMKYGKNYIEWQTSIQGTSLSDFWDYLMKRQGSVKFEFF